MRRFQYSLKSLFVLTTLCCLVCGLMKCLDAGDILVFLLAGGLVAMTFGEVANQDWLVVWGGVAMAAACGTMIVSALVNLGPR